jgi:transglutaminase-like putative cysteine protease
MRANAVFSLTVRLAAVALACVCQTAMAATAPPWMRAQIDVPLPAHDEKANAVLLLAETTLTVQPNGNIRRSQRMVYKILRPAGESLGTLKVHFDDQSKIISMRAWCIPATGKDYEVREKDAVESAVIGVSNSELVSDLRTKLMRIPAAVPGSIIGYEYEQLQWPYMKIDEWDPQETVPVREARYRLQLPPGWTYKSTWLNHADTPPNSVDSNTSQWTLNDIKAVRIESDMPPWRGVAARMVVALIPPSGQASGLQSWRDIGLWYSSLTQDRRAVSPEIKQKVAELTAAAPTQLKKTQALAEFVQSNIRYVAIELGIGGFQPHRAVDIFNNRFGDCKDKVTLLHTMLKEIGIESYYVIVNTERGSVVATTPPSLQFNHAIIAIALPNDLEDPALLARVSHPKLGKLLYFDPTDPLTPFGRLIGALQSSYGVLVTPDGGELLPLPKLPVNSNAIDRTAQMTLDEKGTLRGDIREVWLGDPAGAQRYVQRNVTQEADRIKPLERVAAASFTSYRIVKATPENTRAADQPFEWNYTIEAPNYAKSAGDLLLVRPRIIGSKSSGMLETKEPREHPIEFERPQLDKDIFEIALPNGFEVDELPPAIHLDEGFASYQSKTEVVGRKLRYTRILEIKELSVPVAKAERLRQFYRTIEGDERRQAVLKRVAP